ncbi:MAG: chromosome segregation protein SMC [Planctomycetota bacterium]
MLKALELAGFKSFAERTRFEFPPGITVVVGPNGSGKSNIVDAIKWVLGEQSAKSIRGKEMSDVIFKGSGIGGRKMLNTAEATIIFDNSGGHLGIDAPEVHITRRVYRSGEGEYLINGQGCRLKDVRDLFRGTGVGTDAYSLIEQGKVDRVLRASPRDRRAIFEEAAGISRFKAKKVEAQRRLERVEQNLLRLSDIVEEVGSRFRSVQSQAAKARKYREYSDRLQQLRTRIAMTQWRELADKLKHSELDLQRLGDQVDRLTAELTAEEARGLELDTEIDSAAVSIHEWERLASRKREKITALNSAADHQQSRLTDLEAEASRYRSQLLAMTGRADDVRARVERTRAEVSAAELERERVAGQLAEQEAAVARWLEQLEAWRGSIEDRRALHLANVRQIARLSNEITHQKARAKSAEQNVARSGEKLDKLVQEQEECNRRVDAAVRAKEQVSEEMERTAADLEAATRTLDENHRLLDRRRDELSLQRGRLNGIRERAALLEELERRHEGLTAGVQQVLAGARKQAEGPFQSVVGLVADVIEVPMQWAPLVDAALGPLARHVVVRDQRIFELLESGEFRLAGRVGFLTLPTVAPDHDLETVRLDDDTGVLGRLDELVQTSRELRPLLRQLLGGTWAVEMLAHARRLRATVRPPVRFVTLAGEIVNADGSIVAGPKDTLGLVSRRTELRDRRREEAVVQRQIASAEQEVTRLSENMDQQQQRVRELTERHKQQSEEAARHQARSQATHDQLRQLEGEISDLKRERQATRRSFEEASTRTEEAERQLRELERESADLEAAIQQIEASVKEGESTLQQCQNTVTAIQVDLAKSEQRLDGLRLQLHQDEANRRERSGAISETRDRLAETLEKHQVASREILTATSELATLYLDKDALLRDAAQEHERRRGLLAQRGHVTERLKKKQREIAAEREKLHQCELNVGAVRHEQQALADKLREDYGLELADLEEDYDQQQRQEMEAAEEEIDSLRRKISNIGAVNMEALDELDDLESRFENLNGQYQDLTAAKESLERIIQKINADSRRLFSETLEGIRTNFQSLYRKAFGGGRADIVLEDGVDVLESGVDIVATPPGKPSFNNTLLSGGEKALTAVALLLAIFQYRPSPFCVLDEVDAPFDEANIDRFVDVLKDFLGWTKFVLVTHSKKTMIAATTLYGVTMQESGVSKQVSVRFDDVSEDGHISDEALNRPENADHDDGRAA